MTAPQGPDAAPSAARRRAAPAAPGGGADHRRRGPRAGVLGHQDSADRDRQDEGRQLDVRAMLDLYGVVEEERPPAAAATQPRGQDRRLVTDYEDVLPNGFETFVGLGGGRRRAARLRPRRRPRPAADRGLRPRAAPRRSPGSPCDQVERLVFPPHHPATAAAPRTRPAPLVDGRDEAVLRRAVGGREVMAAQLRSMAELGSGDTSSFRYCRSTRVRMSHSPACSP